MRKKIRKMVKRAVEHERRAWMRAADRLIADNEGMGFHRCEPVGRALRSLLETMNCQERFDLDRVTHIEGLTAVYES